MTTHAKLFRLSVVFGLLAIVLVGVFLLNPSEAVVDFGTLPLLIPQFSLLGLAEYRKRQHEALTQP